MSFSSSTRAVLLSSIANQKIMRPSLIFIRQNQYLIMYRLFDVCTRVLAESHVLLRVAEIMTLHVCRMVSACTRVNCNLCCTPICPYVAPSCDWFLDAGSRTSSLGWGHWHQCPIHQRLARRASPQLRFFTPHQGNPPQRNEQVRLNRSKGQNKRQTQRNEGGATLHQATLQKGERETELPRMPAHVEISNKPVVCLEP